MSDDDRQDPLAQRDRALTQVVPTIPRAPAEGAGPTGRLSGVHTVPLQVRIGRSEDNDIVVDDLLVSRHHADMTLRPEGAWELTDRQSANGTFVNGRRIERAVLEDLDVVTIGHHAFRLVGDRLEEYVDEGEVSLQAVGLTVRTSAGRTLLEDVTFALDERSFLAVVGPSGAGKSTLLDALTGFRPANEGTVLYDGRDLYADYDELRSRIGFVPQQPVVHDTLTVRQELAYAAELRFPPDVGRDERERRVEEVIAQLGLGEARDRPIGRLSGGQRRRVGVGVELLTKPSLLFLDEPTSGLDPGYERELMLLLRELADGGRTVVIVTHRLQSIRLCDRVLFLAPGGRPAYFGPAQLATAYFGREDFEQVFHDLSTREGVDWRARFEAGEEHARYVAGRVDPAAVERAARAKRPGGVLPKLQSPRSWAGQFSMLTRRYARVLLSDRRFVALLVAQPVLLGLLMLFALPADELGPAPDDELRLVSRGGLVLLVLVLGATWLGASNAIREIVREQPLLRRERAAGLGVSAYVWSKVVVLGALTVLQAAILVPLALARQGRPDQGSLLGWPLGELIVAGALAGLAGMALGLFISSVARSADRAMTVLPVVLILQLLLAMGGVFPDVVDKPVLREAKELAGAQWGFAAAASTVDLERLQSVDRLVRDTPTVRAGDPLALLRSLSAEPPEEPRWRHDWPTWLRNAGALVALTLAGVAGSILVLWRRRRDG